MKTYRYEHVFVSKAEADKGNLTAEISKGGDAGGRVIFTERNDNGTWNFLVEYENDGEAGTGVGNG